MLRMLIHQDDIMIFTINVCNISFKINVSKIERMERTNRQIQDSKNCNLLSNADCAIKKKSK